MRRVHPRPALRRAEVLPRPALRAVRRPATSGAVGQVQPETGPPLPAPSVQTAPRGANQSSPEPPPRGANQSSPAGATHGATPEPSLSPDALAAIRQRIRQALQRSLYYPRLARQRGLEGEVLVVFRVARDGRTRELRVVRSAGPVLDAAALQTVRRAGPLPYCPRRIRIPVRYALDD